MDSLLHDHLYPAATHSQQIHHSSRQVGVSDRSRSLRFCWVLNGCMHTRSAISGNHFDQHPLAAGPALSEHLIRWVFSFFLYESLCSLIWDFLFFQINIWTTTTWSNVWLILPKPSWYEFLIIWVLDMNTRFKVFVSYNILRYMWFYPCSYICNCLKMPKKSQINEYSDTSSSSSMITLLHLGHAHQLIKSDLATLDVGLVEYMAGDSCVHRIFLICC